MKRKVGSNASDGDNKKSKSTNELLTYSQFDDLINEYSCSCSLVHGEKKRGGCFRQNFITPSGGLESEKMLKILSLYREKTRKFDKEQKEDYAVKLFREIVLTWQKSLSRLLTTRAVYADRFAILLLLLLLLPLLLLLAREPVAIDAMLILRTTKSKD